MTGVVVDASVALAWCFPDEASDDAEAVLIALEGKTIMVPAVWGLEIANAMFAGERQKRLRQQEIDRFIALLESLSLAMDVRTAREHVNNVLPLAREYGLSAYDAAYLELSLRQRVPLATLDRRLRIAAEKAGIAAFT